MKALSEALMNRRKGQNPMPTEEVSVVDEAPKGGLKAEEVMAMMAPEEKAKLFQMLHGEHEATEPGGEAAEKDDGTAGMEDESGELKSTSGEMEALGEDLTPELAGKIYDEKMEDRNAEKPSILGRAMKRARGIMERKA